MDVNVAGISVIDCGRIVTSRRRDVALRLNGSRSYRRRRWQ